MKLFELFATLSLDKENFEQGVKDALKDSKGLRAEMEDLLKGASGDAQKAKKSWSSTFSEQLKDMSALKSMFTVTGGELIAGAIRDTMSAVSTFANESVDLYSDLTEVQNVVDVTFGDGASVIDAWAQSAKDSFGIGELKAKQYTGTMGAMLKSMGFTNDEAADMSMTIAGLTGDMASFYNLDHDTAFEKIRSGISGETEPLKQLGINMSVVNLESFAMAQGLNKSYSAMTQAEQAALRYEYLLKATADAQGDFAATSGGYANALRLFEENINSVKARVGEMGVDIVTPILNQINDWFAGNEFKTQMDAIAQEESDTIAAAWTQFETTSIIIDDLEKMQGISEEMAAVNDEVAEFANAKATVANTASDMRTELQKGPVNSLFKQVITESGDFKTAAEKFNQYVQGNRDEVNEGPAGENLFTKARVNVSDFIKESGGIEGATNNVRTALTTLPTAVDIFTDAESKAQKAKTSAENANAEIGKVKEALGGEVDNTLNSALGEIVALEQDGKKYSDEWIAALHAIAEVNPGLAQYFNEATGEIYVGLEALKQYSEEIRDLQVYRAYETSANSYKQAAKQQEDVYWNAVGEAGIAEYRMQQAYEAYEKAYAENDGQKSGISFESAQSLNEDQWVRKFGILGPINKAKKAYEDALADAERLNAEAEEAKENADVAQKKIQEVYAAQDAAVEPYIKERAQLQNALADLDSQMAAIEDHATKMVEYRDKAVRASREALQAVASGLGGVDVAAKIRGDAEKSISAMDEIKANLNQQIIAFNQYASDIEAAKSMGMDANLLAMLADGSEQSMADLRTLVSSGEGSIEEINALYQQSQEAQANAAEGMANAKLSVDETFQGMQTQMNEMVENFDKAAEAATAINKTGDAVDTAMWNMIQDIQARAAQVNTAYSGLIAILGQDIQVGTLVMPDMGGLSESYPDIRMNQYERPATNAKGIGYVPYDNYLTYLHKGETVLARPEAEDYRNNIATPVTIDYDKLGVSVAAAISGMAVQMDATTVGYLVLPTVSQGIAYNAYSERYTR